LVTILSDAVSSIQFKVVHRAVQQTLLKEESDLASGTGGCFRYLRMIRDSSSNLIITDIKLFRSTNENDRPALAAFTPYNSYTGDNNANRKVNLYFKISDLKLFRSSDQNSRSAASPYN